MGNMFQFCLFISCLVTIKAKSNAKLFSMMISIEFWPNCNQIPADKKANLDHFPIIPKSPILQYEVLKNFRMKSRIFMFFQKISLKLLFLGEKIYILDPRLGCICLKKYWKRSDLDHYHSLKMSQIRS